jgi:PadR family transcriptional regulator, regulatory protein PadR
MRTTYTLLQVVAALMEDADARHWGYDLTRRAGVRSGALYPILGRMLDEGWLTDGWEDPTEIGSDRPPRRYYSITEHGLRQMGALLAKAQDDARFSTLKARAGW